MASRWVPQKFGKILTLTLQMLFYRIDYSKDSVFISIKFYCEMIVRVVIKLIKEINFFLYYHFKSLWITIW